ncbi:MAG: hypothetical protein U1F68_03285 [Gammaproteobacteria bacterium]
MTSSDEGGGRQGLHLAGGGEARAEGLARLIDCQRFCSREVGELESVRLASWVCIQAASQTTALAAIKA